MDNYTKEILTILKNKHNQIVGEKPYQNTTEAREFYLEHLNDNLYSPMSVGADASYRQGSGDEIESGKMNALRSSSAMTCNLFWDQIAEIRDTQDAAFGTGIYQVEFEKQFHTLKPEASRFPANLDAFLYCKHTKEAIACEMKMTEWIFNKPGSLKNAYLNPENYINVEAGQVFVDVANALILNNDYEDPETTQSEYLPITSRYDAFQMFKHTVACYTACAEEEPREIKKLTLVNCAWTLSEPTLLSPKSCERYQLEEALELAEFAQFKTVMEPVKKLFSSIGVDFDIKFYTFSEFLTLFHKTEDELDYLRRYTLT